MEKIAVKVGADISDFRQDMNKLGGIAGRQGGIINQKFLLIAAGATAAAGAIAAIGYAIKKVADHAILVGAPFERALQDVGAVARATTEEMEGLRQTAIDIGRDASLKGGFQEAADAMYDLASAGLTANEVMAATRDVMMLAGAVNADTALSARAVSDALVVFSLDAEEARRVADVYSEAISGSKNRLDTLTLAMSYAAPAAASMGMSLEEATAAVMAFSNMGMEASRAGNAFRASLAALAEMTPKAEAVLESLGVTMAEISPLTHNFEEIVSRLAETELDAADAAAIWGREYGSSMALLIKQTREGTISLDEMKQSLFGASEGIGRTAEMMARQMANWEGATNRAKKAQDDFWRSIWEAIKGPLTEGKHAISGIVEEMSEWVVANEDLIRQDMATLFDAMIPIAEGVAVAIRAIAAAMHQVADAAREIQAQKLPPGSADDITIALDSDTNIARAVRERRARRQRIGGEDWVGLSGFGTAMTGGGGIPSASDMRRAFKEYERLFALVYAAEVNASDERVRLTKEETKARLKLRMTLFDSKLKMITEEKEAERSLAEALYKMEVEQARNEETLIRDSLNLLTASQDFVLQTEQELTRNAITLSGDREAQIREEYRQRVADFELAAMDLIVDEQWVSDQIVEINRQGEMEITELHKKEAQERERQEQESLRVFETAWGNTLSTIAGLLADFMTGAEVSWRDFFETLKRIAAQALSQSIVDIAGRWIKDIIGGIFGGEGGGGSDIFSLLSKIPGLVRGYSWITSALGIGTGATASAATGAGSSIAAGAAGGAGGMTGGAAAGGLGMSAGMAAGAAGVAFGAFLAWSIANFEAQSANRWAARVGRMSPEERAFQEEQYYPWMTDWQSEMAGQAEGGDYAGWWRAGTSAHHTRFRWDTLAESLGQDPTTWAQQRMTPEQFAQYQLQGQQHEAMQAVEGFGDYARAGVGRPSARILGATNRDRLIAEMADLGLGEETAQLLELFEAGTIDLTEAMARLRLVIMDAANSLDIDGDGAGAGVITTAEEFTDALTGLRDRTLTGEIWTDLLGEDFVNSMSGMTQHILGGLQGTFYDMLGGFIDALDAGTLSFEDIDEIVRELTERMGELTTVAGILRAETDAINLGVDLLTAKSQTLEALFAGLVWGEAGTAEWEAMFAQFMTTQGDVMGLADMMAGFQDIQTLIMGGDWRETYAERGYATPEEYLRALFEEAAELAEALGLEDPMTQVAEAVEALQTVLADLIVGVTGSTEAEAANTEAEAANTAAQAANTEATDRLTNALANVGGGGRGYQHGGVVQPWGPYTNAVPIIAHVGETIIPRGGNAGAINITVNANGLTLDDPAVLNKVAKTIRAEIEYSDRAARN